MKANRMNFGDEIEEEMTRELSQVSSQAKRLKQMEQKLSSSPLDLFRKKYIKRTLIFLLIWCSAIVIIEYPGVNFISGRLQSLLIYHSLECGACL